MQYPVDLLWVAGYAEFAAAVPKRPESCRREPAQGTASFTRLQTSIKCAAYYMLIAISVRPIPCTDTDRVSCKPGTYVGWLRSLLIHNFALFAHSCMCALVKHIHARHLQRALLQQCCSLFANIDCPMSGVLSG